MAASTPPVSATPFRERDRVVVIARDQTAADIKSGLYFPHFGNLKGSILKIYGEEASVLVSRESLPGNVLARHEEGETAERKKYLDRLSEDARNRLSPREKEFNLNYSVLVAIKDLRPDTGAPTPAPAPPTEADRAEAQVVARAMESVDPITGESIVGDATLDGEGTDESGTDSAAKRVTAGELDANEAAFLAQKRKGAKRGA